MVKVAPALLADIEEGRRQPDTALLLRIGAAALPGPAKTMIVQELRMRLREFPFVQVVG